MRIAKFLSRMGVCSRREAERYIEQGRVSLNGKAIETPATIIDEENDVIEVDGVKITSQERANDPNAKKQKDNKSLIETKLWLYNKPLGLVTSHKDEKDRKTVIDDVKQKLNVSHIITVGRLDINSEGLLLLTNNGELSRYLELPQTGWKRKYRIKVHGKINEKKLESLKNGCKVDGVEYGPIIVDIEKKGTGTNHWLNVTLSEGKNREIRKVMKSLGLDVARLIRVSYGPFMLGNLQKGEIKQATKSALKNAIGKALNI